MSGYVECGSGRLYYAQAGTGTAVIFIHGFTLDHRMWEPQIRYFAGRGYKVIAYDARGFGRSSLPSEPYSHTQDLLVLLDRLSLPNAHIVGLSMGGRIATNFALEHPDRVITLSLLDSALDGFADTVDWDTESRKAGLAAAKAGWLAHRLFAATRTNRQANDLCTRIVTEYSGWHWYHDDPQLPITPAARLRLPQLKRPTLVIVGERDLSYFRDIATELSEWIPLAKLAVVNGVGHMVNLEAPTQVNGLLESHFTADRG